MAARLVAAALLALACLAAAPAAWPQPAPLRNEATLTYRGADRTERLIERARREGSVVVYTSLAPAESTALAQAFEKKYAIKVELWRAVSERVLSRTLTEARGKRFAVDVIETNGMPELEIMAREKLLAAFYSPHVEDLPPFAVPAHRQWISDRMQFFVVAYNTNKFAREDMPKTYEGFLDPKWKGKLGIEANDAAWFATLIKLRGGEPGVSFFTKLAEMRPDVRKGHILLAELVAAGEIAVGLTIYNSHAEALKKRGAPIDWVPIEPVVALPQAIAVARQAPHPNAALLFVDFVLSPEGQELFARMGRVPSSLGVKTRLNDFRYTLIDAAATLDDSAKWEKAWEDLFIKR